MKKAGEERPQPQPGRLNNTPAGPAPHYPPVLTTVTLTAMTKIFCITLLAWVSLWMSSASAQEYLPPKQSGGGGGNIARKPAVQEPTLPANYEYTYDVQDSAVSLDFGHTEKRKDERATGSYHVLLPDGRTQLVEYEAGPEGYKPQVMYMGTATFPAQPGGGSGGGADKFEGYHYNAAATRQSVRQAAPRRATPAPPPPAPAPPPLYSAANANTTQ